MIQCNENCLCGHCEFNYFISSESKDLDESCADCDICDDADMKVWNCSKFVEKNT